RGLRRAARQLRRAADRSDHAAAHLRARRAMNRELLRSVRRHSLLLGLFAAAAAVIVALVHEFTREEIALQRLAAERRALYEVLPPAAHDNDLLADTLTLSEDSGLRELDLLGLR